MRIIPFLGAAALGAFALPFLPHPGADASPAAVVTSPRPAGPEAFRVDPAHSSVVFKVKHMGAAWFYGRFDQVSGQLAVDEENPSNCSAKIEIAVESVNTNSKKRDQHLLSPDFFDAKQFPELSFESSKVSREGDNWKMQGTLNFHGVKKDITVDVEKTGEGAARGGGTLAGFHTTFTINRSEFGVDYMKGGLGEEVEITISLEAVSK